MKRRKNERGKKSLERTELSRDYVKFDCLFTPEIRKKFKEKRQYLGLSLHGIAEIIGADWSTIRKWETGKTKNCNIRYRVAVEDFLNDDVNDILLKCQGKGDLRHLESRRHSSEIDQALDKIKTTCRLCCDRPDLCEYIWNSLNALSRMMLMKLASEDPKR